jgi:hypothetical protein
MRNETFIKDFREETSWKEVTWKTEKEMGG